jgi:KipI family sensor histidine kinase inhibitor
MRVRLNTRLMGDSALLIDVEDAQAAQFLFEAVRRQSLKGIYALIPAYNTLLVEFDPLKFDVMKLISRLPQIISGSAFPIETSSHEIQVAYNGEDLDEVARVSGLIVADVIEIHSTTVYTVAFLGFAPGFPYLVGMDTRLHLPRLKSPRTQVPAGAVAIAGEFCGIYPQATPGGWRVLAHTDAVLFDIAWPMPALLKPGDKVRFHPLP